MTPLCTPRWIRVVSAALGGVALVLSGVCFFAPQLLFGVDAYPLLPRIAIGLLGAASAGLGVLALLAAVEGDVATLRAAVLALFVASALIPSVVIFNIGAFNQADPTGWSAFIVAGGVILLMSVPLLLSLRVLSRLRRVATAQPATRTRPTSRVARTAAE